MSNIVLLMGVDGSGKSSLTSMLFDELKEKGIETVIVWASLRPVLMKPFILIAKFLMVRNRNKFDDWDAHISAKKAGMKKMSWARHLYLLVTFIDYVPQVFFKVYLPRVFGKLVICDRYYHDLVLDYGITTQANNEKVLDLLRYSSWIFPKPDLNYLLSVPAEVALSRKTDIPSTDYLQERADVYHVIAGEIGATILDGTMPLQDNCGKILEDILHLRGKAGDK